MRESDQASFIQGAYELASGDNMLELSLYMPEKAYLAYCLYSVPASLFLFVRNVWGLGIDDLILFINSFQVVFFVSCLFFFLRKSKFFNDGWIVVSVCLLSPAILFTVPFVACSVLALGFLLLLAVCHQGDDQSRYRLCGSFLLSFCAVACRADTVLVLPALVVLYNREDAGLAGLFRRGSWVIALGAVCAMVVGNLLFPGGKPLTTPFFNFKMWAGYIAFGWGACFILLVMLVGSLVWLTLKTRKIIHVVSFAVLLVPCLFYSFFLFSPRYYMLSILVVLLSVTGKYGQFVWGEVLQVRWMRRALNVMLVLVAMTWVVGVNVDKGIDKVRLGINESCSVFPTADGVWPMGGYASFVCDLSQAEAKPVDHNQRIWSAWKAMDTQYLENMEKGSIILEGTLVSYPRLYFRYLGLSDRLRSRGENNSMREGYRMMDSRNLVRRKSSFRGVLTEDEGPEKGEWKLKVLGRGMGHCVFMSVEESLVVEDKLWSSDLEVIRTHFRGLLGFYRWSEEIDETIPSGYTVIVFSDNASQAREALGEGIKSRGVNIRGDDFVGLYSSKQLSNLSQLADMRVYVSEYVEAFNMMNR